MSTQADFFTFFYWRYMWQRKYRLPKHREKGISKSYELHVNNFAVTNIGDDLSVS